MVDSCQHCDQCHKGEEQLCREGNDRDLQRPPTASPASTPTAAIPSIVVRQEFVLRSPEGWTSPKPHRCSAPASRLWSPLRTWNVGPGSRVGVIGLGGLGHMAVKLAVRPRRGRDGAEPLTRQGSRRVGTWRGPLAGLATRTRWRPQPTAFDLIIDTVPTKHSLDPYLPLLDIDGTLVIVGQIGPMEEMSTRAAADGPPPRRRIAHRRHPRDPRDARLLRREEHLPDVRDDPHGSDQRGLRSDGKAPTCATAS
jgi:uncharacterized zinc-type alcohol dehydrogenase-like protein